MLNGPTTVHEPCAGSGQQFSLWRNKEKRPRPSSMATSYAFKRAAPDLQVSLTGGSSLVYKSSIWGKGLLLSYHLGFPRHSPFAGTSIQITSRSENVMSMEGSRRGCQVLEGKLGFGRCSDI